MKKLLLIIFSLSLLLTGCFSSKIDYKLDTWHSLMPAPNHQKNLVYGSVYTNLPLREVILINTKTKKKYISNFISPEHLVYSGDLHNFFYFANLPSGTYSIYEITASKKVYNGVRYLLLTFENGTENEIKIKKGSVTYMGKLMFLKPKVLKKLQSYNPNLKYYFGKSEQRGRILIANGVQDKKDNIKNKFGAAVFLVNKQFIWKKFLIKRDKDLAKEFFKADQDSQ